LDSLAIAFLSMPYSRSANSTGAFGEPLYRFLSVILGFAAFYSGVKAQTALCAQDNGKPLLIRRAEGTTAFALKEEKWTAFREGPFALLPASEYYPTLIDIIDQNFKKGERAISDNGPSSVHLVHSGRFVFNADIEAQSSLDNVVLVLTLVSPQDGEQQYIREIGELKAHRMKRISFDAITSYRLIGVRLEHVHIYSDGREVFTSHVSLSDRRRALDEMVTKRLSAVKDAKVKPLFMIQPAYPNALKPKIKGEAMISCLVDAHGKVSNPSLISATNPAFAGPALEAVKEWRFIPEVREGVAVESKVSVPFTFDPL
jgi:TonB family protein